MKKWFEKVKTFVSKAYESWLDREYKMTYKNVRFGASPKPTLVDEREMLYKREEASILTLFDLEPSSDAEVFKSALDTIIDMGEKYVNELDKVKDLGIPLDVGLSLDFQMFALSYNGNLNKKIMDISSVVTYIDACLVKDIKFPPVNNVLSHNNVRSQIDDIETLIHFLKVSNKMLKTLRDMKGGVLAYFKVKPIFFIMVTKILITRRILEHYY